MAKKDKKKELKLIGRPFEYGGDEEADKPCMCGECLGHAQSRPDKPLLNTKKEVDDKD